MNRLDSEVAEPVASRRSRLPAVMAALVVVVGGAAAVAALNLQYWTEFGPGPGFFPLWLGVLLVVFGAIWFATLQRGPVEPRTESAPDEAPQTTGDHSPATVVAIVVSLCVLAGVLEVLGYQLSMLLFLLFHLLVLGRRGVLLSSVISLAGSFGVFLIFTRLLSVSLPASSIPFLRDLGL
ncbi:tripartite tricarboxylate transporter TctB family protein [Actinophytocola sediminis]